jgi:fibronectin type 3 domain-containing protein
MRRLYAAFLALTLTVVPGLAACNDADDGGGLPSAPGSLRANFDASSGVSLTWVDASDEEDKYVVQRKDVISGQDFAVLAELPADTVKYTDMAVKADTVYRYRVLAVNSFGESPSDEVQIGVQ